MRPPATMREVSWAAFTALSWGDSAAAAAAAFLPALFGPLLPPMSLLEVGGSGPLLAVGRFRPPLSLCALCLALVQASQSQLACRGQHGREVCQMMQLAYTSPAPRSAPVHQLTAGNAAASLLQSACARTLLAGPSDIAVVHIKTLHAQ